MSRTLYILDLDGLEQLQPNDENKERVRKMWTSPTSQMSEFLWLSNQTVAYKNGSSLLHFSIAPGASETPIKVLDFPNGTEPSTLKYDADSRALVFSAAVWEDNLELTETAAGNQKYEDRGDSGLVLDDLFVRHWDTWRIPGKIYTLGMTRLNQRSNKRQEDGSEGDDPDAEFTGDRNWVNILKGTGLYSQMDAISEFSLSGNKVAVALKPNDISVAVHTRMELWVVDLDNLGAEPKQLTPGNLGAVSGVEYSPDGSKIAWLQMAQDGYESDKRVVTVHTFESSSDEAWTQEWDRSPSSIAWSVDSQTLYVTSEYKGRVLPYHIRAPGQLPTPLLFNGSTGSIAPLTDSTFLLSVSSMQHPTEIFFLDLEEGDGPDHDPHKLPAEQVYQVTHYSTEFIGGRLDAIKPEEMWFRGADGRNVMAWVLKPRGWSESDAAGSWPLGESLCLHVDAPLCMLTRSLLDPRRPPECLERQLVD